jgi:hypothetical protein
MELDKKELAFVMAELGKVVKQEKSADYRSGYVDGILDFYNEATKILVK